MIHLEKAGIKVMARNREAYHEYFVEEEFEAGIELVGTEVKSIRAGTLNLKDAWCGIKDGEMILNQMPSTAGICRSICGNPVPTHWKTLWKNTPSPLPNFWLWMI